MDEAGREVRVYGDPRAGVNENDHLSAGPEPPLVGDNPRLRGPDWIAEMRRDVESEMTTGSAGAEGSADQDRAEGPADQNRAEGPADQNRAEDSADQNRAEGPADQNRAEDSATDK